VRGFGLCFHAGLEAALVAHRGRGYRRSGHIGVRAPVLDLILDRLGSTLALSLGGIVFAVAIGLSTGVLAALKQGSWVDTFSMLLAYIGVSMPLFWLGLLLILVFSFGLGWFPPAGESGLLSLVLPSLTLGLVSAGVDRG